MSVLIVGFISVEDPAELGPYKEAAGASMQEFGISMLAQAAPTEVLEGTLPGPITAVLEADSEEKVRAWYSSDAYKKAIAARSPNSRFTIAMVPKAG